MAVGLSVASAIVSCNAIVDKLDDGAGAGVIEFYDGTRPTDADTAVGAQVLLGTVTYGDPAYGGAVDANPGAIATANATVPDTNADAGGTATWARHKDSDGNTVFDNDVGLTGSGAGIIMNSVTIVAGQTIQINSITYTQPET